MHSYGGFSLWLQMVPQRAPNSELHVMVNFVAV